ncbi:MULTISPECIES: ABC transporter substrate-binding protein [unclassified Chelatococcus]|uniref:ABC transporter substrate-binding protein n=1 Tax=unclassified Chelatococcus TaxID=2638111 RepID=UPI001BCDD35D|nr:MULTISPECIES: ABC transporter substrate-binding protein [unclassified Chelatococcus]MBS7699567.1 hypothetical protein [Chelatococcus sp. YT9]MBX3559999.1 hypothetical protein [Chelatococcus sp.]
MQTRFNHRSGLSRRHLLAGLGSAAGLALVAPTWRGARAAGTPLRVGLSAYPSNFSPFANVGTAAETVKLQSFRGLMSYEPDGQLRGELAESWKQEDDTTVVFTLRPAKFHNGDPVTADDVVFSFETMGAEPSTAFMKPFFASLAAIEAVDPKTVRIKLKAPDAAFLVGLASYDAPVVSRRSMKEDATKPVGAGPYQVTGMERGTAIDLKAFDGFYRPGLPKSPLLRFVVYADESARVAALRSGDVDLIEYVPSPAMGAIEEDANLALDAVEGPASLVMFNVKSGPFVDPRVRRAVGYAIDRQAIIDGAFSGRAALSGPLPLSRASPYFDPASVDIFKRDLAKAKALLAEAGYPNGFKTSILATSQYSVHRDPAIVIQRSLVDVGIQGELNLPDWATRVQLGNKGQYHMSVTATSLDNNDPAGLDGVLGSGLPPAFSRPWGYVNAEVDRLVRAGRSTLDVDKRKAIYADLEKAVVADPGIISLVFRHQAYARRKAVSGFVNLPGFLTLTSGFAIETASVG